MFRHALFALLALIAAPLLAAPVPEVVREQHSFSVNGVREIWRLIWRGAPRDINSCSLADPGGSTT